MERELNKDYKIDSENAVENMINENAKQCGAKLDIADRLDVVRKNDTYLLVKDHKQSFYRMKQCRLINPTKTHLE